MGKPSTTSNRLDHRKAFELTSWIMAHAKTPDKKYSSIAVMAKAATDELKFNVSGSSIDHLLKAHGLKQSQFIIKEPTSGSAPRYLELVKQFKDLEAEHIALMESHNSQAELIAMLTDRVLKVDSELQAFKNLIKHESEISSIRQEMDTKA